MKLQAGQQTRQANNIGGNCTLDAGRFHIGDLMHGQAAHGTEGGQTDDQQRPEDRIAQ